MTHALTPLQIAHSEARRADRRFLVRLERDGNTAFGTVHCERPGLNRAPVPLVDVAVCAARAEGGVMLVRIHTFGLN